MTLTTDRARHTVAQSLPATASIEYRGERHPITSDTHFTIGRDGDLRVGDDTDLHRRFLRVSCPDGLWWLSNVGATLSATITDGDGRLRSWLAPGASQPLMFRSTTVVFSTGGASHQFTIHTGARPA